MVELLIKNGRVIDPLRGIDRKADVAVVRNRIVDAGGTVSAERVVDAEGCYVFPGLIDFHTHVFYGGSGFSLKPDWMLSTGVTATVDAGTSGCANFESFYKGVVETSTVRVKTQLSVFSGGQLGMDIIENFDPALFNIRGIDSICEKYRDNILGFKIRLSQSVVGDLGVTPLVKTIEIAEKIGNMSVCVHATDPPCPTSELAGMLRPGDVFCHCFHGKGDTIIEKGKNVYEEVRAARRRGVLFDAANGKGNFALDTAKCAIENGFLPDIISTDLLNDKFGLSLHAKNLPMVMSKYLAMGVSLPDVVKAVTETPAGAMGMEGRIGTLRPGAFADIAVFKLEQKRACYLDSRSESMEGSQVLMPQMTIAGGQIVFCQNDFNIT